MIFIQIPISVNDNNVVTELVFLAEGTKEAD